MSTDDDEALTWAGDESSPRVAETPRTERLRDRGMGGAARTADGRSATIDSDVIDDIDDAPTAQTGGVALVVLSLLGGFHVLYGIGWALAIGPLQAAFRPTDALGTAMFSLGLVFAVASPFVWFSASLWFTRTRAPWVRIAAVFAGVVLLVPWPFLVATR